MKNRLWLVLMLLGIWLGFSNNFYFLNFLLGLGLSVLIPYLVRPKPLNFDVNLLQLFLLGLYVIVELFRSSLQVAWDILTPVSKSQSKIIKIPLQCKHPTQISLLANLISLTPGTLAVDIEENNSVLVLHVMFAQKQVAIVNFIKNKLEPKIMKVIKHD